MGGTVAELVPVTDWVWIALVFKWFQLTCDLEEGEWGLRVCGFTGTFIGGVGCSFWHFKRVCVLGGGRRGGVNVCSPLALLDGGGGVGEYY